MAMKAFVQKQQDHQVSGWVRKPWLPVVLALTAAAVLLTSIKAIGILLPYINSQLF